MKTEVEVKCYNKEEMNYHKSQMKRYGYKKTSDCMWVLIYEKENSKVILTREY